jgi:hypothetical protein
MTTATLLAALLAGLMSSPAAQPSSSSSPLHPYGYLGRDYLYRDGRVVRKTVPYQPREGDWIFFDDQSRWWEFLYTLADTSPPFHAGIVVKKPDGELAVLEAGPDDTLHVYVLDIIPRLHEFKGVIYVRQCKKILTPEESARLTAFAEKQKGKGYAMWRLLAQGGPLKTRGGPLRHYCAHTLTNRWRWLCAEITVTGSAVAGITDPKKVRGSNTYPSHIIDNKIYDLSAVYEDAAHWQASPAP